MSVKKPTALYRFDSLKSGDKKILKHKICKGCCPQIEINWFDKPEYAYQYGGNLWRCNCASGDHFGYATRAEAILEEKINTRNRILEDRAWLRKLDM
jgi:uncharacterized membrane-anchored protein